MSATIKGGKREVRPGVWEINASSGRRTDGGRRRVYRRVRGSEDDADAALERLKIELGGSRAVGDSMTLDTYFTEYFLVNKASTRTKATVDFYKSAYCTHIKDELGGMNVGEIPTATIKRWASTLPPSSAPAYVRALRAIMRSAWEDGFISERPMSYRIELPRRDTAPMPVWGPETASEAMRRLRGVDIEPLALVMLGAGLSASEARARDWEDLSSDCTEITVDSAYTQRDGMKGPKNSRRYRTVPVLPLCAKRLSEIRSRGPICLNKKGERMGPGTVPRRWKALWESGGALEGLPHINMNRLRATHETLMLRAGVPDALNSAIHGHSQKVAYSNYLAPVCEDAVNAAVAANGLLEQRTPTLRFVD